VRKLFWQMMVSLDGFAEGPKRELDWHVTDGDFNRYVHGMLDSIDAILLGRVSYQMFADYWPTSTDSIAPKMNALTKIVFSRSFKEPLAWQNSRLAGKDTTDEVARLKREPGRDLALFGSADLASTFIRLGLIDEYRLMINPVVLGNGLPAFKNRQTRMSLELAETKTLTSGVVLLTYRPAAQRVPAR
jgi:dihydrofolate reductase